MNKKTCFGESGRFFSPFSRGKMVCQRVCLQLIQGQKILCCLAVVLFFFSGCDQEREQSVVETTARIKTEVEGKIVALGDSLTAGLGVDTEKSYPSLLQQKLKEHNYNFQVINAGVSGETSSGTLSRLNWILKQKPDIVILEIGANDGLRGIDVTLIENNIRNILQILQEHDVVTVLAGMKIVTNMGETYSGRFNGLYSTVVQDTGVIHMPFFLEGVATDPELNGPDGIHPNAAGYRRITTNLFPYVERAILQSRKDEK